MPQHSNREKLLKEGLRVVHERGFGAASVRDIVQAAGVPQGSFTNHFASKEAFGLEVIELYHSGTKALVARTLRNDAMPPLQRLEAWLDTQLDYLKRGDMRKGCLYGNFSAEASEQSEVIRQRIAAIYSENQASVAYCLRAAIDARELSPSLDVEEISGIVISSLQGAILVAKAQRSPEPFERFRRLLFSTVLRRDEAPPADRRGTSSRATPRSPRSSSK